MIALLHFLEITKVRDAIDATLNIITISAALWELSETMVKRVRSNSIAMVEMKKTWNSLSTF